MKKENKQMARLRKAQAKKKRQQQERIKKIAMIAVPIILFTALILVLSFTNAGNNDTSSDPSGSTATDSVSSLNTDTSLVVEDGDTVNIDYVGTINGVEFGGGSTGGMGTDLTIGSGMYIDGFEDQLIGHSVGETVDVICTFPDNYGETSLAGKEAVFTTVINGIYK